MHMPLKNDSSLQLGSRYSFEYYFSAFPGRKVTSDRLWPRPLTPCGDLHILGTFEQKSIFRGNYDDVFYKNDFGAF